jgi:putative ABC transport system permease protein
VRFELGPILRSVARQKGTFSLVVVELAIGFTVVSCLVLAASWYLSIGHAAVGYAERDLVLVTLHVPASDGADPRRRADGELDAIRAVPGVAAAAPVTTSLLDERWRYPAAFWVVDAGRDAAGGRPTGEPIPIGWTYRTTPAIFDVLDLKLIEGRSPGTRGDVGAVTVLSRCLRDRLFAPGAPAVGRMIASEDATPALVIGVMEDAMMNTPFMPSAGCVGLRFSGLTDEHESRYLVRAAPGRRAAVVAALAGALGPAGPDRYLSVRAFDSRTGKHHHIAEGLVVMLGIIGATVALLGLIGVLAASSFLVTERTRQIGIRRALGGARGDIIRYFLVEVSLAVALGTGLGLGATLLLFLFMKRVFSPLHLEWWWLVLNAVSLWLSAVVAAMLPARRAARIPPSVAARAQ